MAIGSLIALAIASIGSALIGGAISHSDNERNIDFTKETNQQNLDLQREVNAQNQYNMEHAHQIEMKDLEAAGLNPVLTATGGSGAPLAQQNAATMKAPNSDLSGVGSAISSALNSLTMLTMASSMAKSNAALATMRETGRNTRFNARQAAYGLRNQSTFSPKGKQKVVAKSIQEALDDDPNDWSFLDDM